jgi:hypothetical protein
LGVFLAVGLATTTACLAQQQPKQQPAPKTYSRANSFGILFAYSNTSSHMLLGAARNRKLLNVGASYSRRLWMNRVVNWQYDAEFIPVALESDPVKHEIDSVTSPVTIYQNFTYRDVAACRPVNSSFNATVGGVLFASTQVVTCFREWTVGEAFSPIGFRWSFRPRHRLQPFLGGHGGEMYSTRPIPIDEAGSFNFTFDFDGGLEWYRAHQRSIRFEYRYHHISNHNTANQNPGIDNGLFQVSYVFGH